MHSLLANMNMRTTDIFNFVPNMAQLKEDRWLFRGSLLTGAMTYHNNSHIQSKKLLGHTYLNPRDMGRSVWGSTNISKLDYTAQLRQLSSTKQGYAEPLGLGTNRDLSTFITPLTDLNSINSFEASRF
jgi:hypothetical protein